jgi:polysaccharide pyruvyl transferase WcaK-like protein
VATASEAVHRADRPRAAAPPLRLCYFGAAPDTGNLGVSALCYAAVGSLARLCPDAALTVFDHGRGVRPETQVFDGQPFEFVRCGACQTRRIWRPESFWNIAFLARFGGLGSEQVRRLRTADAVFDISGGDSFTDLYGPKRFASVAASKRLALRLGRPLVLLPQTYGPYRDVAVRAEAGEIIRRAAVAWARDARSFETLRDLAGGDFDPARHRCGVDVAFALDTHPPRLPLPEPIASWLSGSDPACLSGRWQGEGGSAHEPATLGINISGLIWNDPVAMRERYGFKADYREVVLGFLRHVLVTTDANVLLVPHVMTPPGHYESDPGANNAALAALRDDAASAVRSAAAARVRCVPATTDHPSETKWIIARCDWFCGTRMHACIAGLSSGVPTAAIAYSLKTQGVFETCGQGDAVVDPRVLDTPAVIERLAAALRQRAAAAAELRGHVGGLQRQAREQIRACLVALPGVGARVQEAAS